MARPRSPRPDSQGPKRPPKGRPAKPAGPSGERAVRSRTAAARPAPRSRSASAEIGPERLHKILAQAGVGSRRACELLILEGRVTVDGEVIRELGTKVDPKASRIAVDGQRIHPEDHVYYLVYKPKGYVSTSEDPSGRPLVLDLVPKAKERIFIVGRLDRHSEGLMLLTNDGSLAQRLTHPSFGVEKTYRVTVAGDAGHEVVTKLTDGVWLAEGKVRARRARIVAKRGNVTVMEVVLAEGKNREIRRMLARLEHKVLSLVRVAIGPLQIKGLSEGGWRTLTDAEVERLRTTTSVDAHVDEGPRRPRTSARPGADRDDRPRQRPEGARGRYDKGGESSDDRPRQRPEGARGRYDKGGESSGDRPRQRPEGARMRSGQGSESTGDRPRQRPEGARMRSGHGGETSADRPRQRPEGARGRYDKGGESTGDRPRQRPEGARMRSGQGDESTGDRPRQRPEGARGRSDDARRGPEAGRSRGERPESPRNHRGADAISKPTRKPPAPPRREEPESEDLVFTDRMDLDVSSSPKPSGRPRSEPAGERPRRERPAFRPKGKPAGSGRSDAAGDSRGSSDERRPPEARRTIVGQPREPVKGPVKRRGGPSRGLPPRKRRPKD